MFLTAGVEFLFLSALNQLGGGTLTRIAAASLLAIYATLFTIDYGYYRRLGSPIGASLLRLALREPEDTRIVFAEEFGRGDTALLAAVLAMAVLPAILGKQRQYQASAAYAATVCALLLVAAMARANSVTVTSPLSTCMWPSHRPGTR